MREKEITEGLGELADIAERDHEVQMARADLYKSAKYAIKLHEMLKGVSEAEGLEGWVQSKITKASEMLGSVYHHMDYEESGLADEAMVVGEAKDTHCSDKCCGSDVKAEDCTCPPTCKHCNCNATNESTNVEESRKGPFNAKGAGIGAAIGSVAGPAITAMAGGSPAATAAGKLGQAALGAGLGAVGGSVIGAINKSDAEIKRKRKAKLAKAKKDKEAKKEQTYSEGPFKGVGKQLMKRKLNKQYKKSDLANFDKSGIDTSGKTPDEIGQMKSDYYHDNMDKAARAKKAGDRLSRKKESYKEELHLKLEGKKKFKSAAHRKAVHAAKASGKR